MILNIRGTHGSGKSTMVKAILDRYHATPHIWKETVRSRKPLLYSSQELGTPLFIVGPYETACGGCDAIQPYDDIWPLVIKFADRGNVLFEGALVSSSVGNIGRAMAARKDCIVAFMDTPLEVCLDRIRARRLARGDDRPLNPHNTEVKFHGILRSRPQLEALGLHCVDLHHKRATAEVLKLLGVK